RFSEMMVFASNRRNDRRAYCLCLRAARSSQCNQIRGRTPVTNCSTMAVAHARRCRPSPHIPHPELCDLCCIYLTWDRYWCYALPKWHPTHVPQCHQFATHLAATGCHKGAENGRALVYTKMSPLSSTPAHLSILPSTASLT